MHTVKGPALLRQNSTVRSLPPAFLPWYPSISSDFFLQPSPVPSGPVHPVPSSGPTRWQTPSTPGSPVQCNLALAHKSQIHPLSPVHPASLSRLSRLAPPFSATHLQASCHPSRSYPRPTEARLRIPPPSPPTSLPPAAPWRPGGGQKGAVGWQTRMTAPSCMGSL